MSEAWLFFIAGVAVGCACIVILTLVLVRLYDPRVNPQRWICIRRSEKQ